MGSIVERKARSEVFSLQPYVPGKPVEELERELGITGVIKLASMKTPWAFANSGSSSSGSPEALNISDGACHLRQPWPVLWLVRTLSWLATVPDELLRLLVRPVSR